MSSGRARRFRRVRTPAYLQMEATECGAASLGILLEYFGRYVPLEELRVECRVSRDGSNALFIKKTGEKYGLTGKGMKATAEALRGLKPPFMAFWEMNHFLVVEGFAGGRVFLNDPATGRRSIGEAEFRESYSGIAFRFEPGPSFRKGGKRPGLFRAIASRAAPVRAAILFAVLAGLALAIADLVASSFPLVFIDGVLVAGRWRWVRPLVAAIGLTAVFRLLVRGSLLRTMRGVQAGLASAQSAKFLWHVLRLPVAFFQHRYAGEVAGRIDGNSAVANLITGQLASTLLGFLMIALFAAIMAAIDPALAAVGVVSGS